MSSRTIEQKENQKVFREDIDIGKAIVPHAFSWAVTGGTGKWGVFFAWVFMGSTGISGLIKR